MSAPFEVEIRDQVAQDPAAVFKAESFRKQQPRDTNGGIDVLEASKSVVLELVRIRVHRLISLHTE